MPFLKGGDICPQISFSKKLTVAYGKLLWNLLSHTCFVLSGPLPPNDPLFCTQSRGNDDGNLNPMVGPKRLVVLSTVFFQRSTLGRFA